MWVVCPPPSGGVSVSRCNGNQPERGHGWLPIAHMADLPGPSWQKSTTMIPHGATSWQANKSLLPTGLRCGPFPVYTPKRTGPLMMSDGMPSSWSTGWAPRPARTGCSFADTFSASARAMGFPTTPPQPPPRDVALERRPFGNTPLRQLPGHSFPTLPLHASHGAEVLGPVPVTGTTNRKLLPTEPLGLGLKHLQGSRPLAHSISDSSLMSSSNDRSWVMAAEPSRFEAQGPFTRFAHLNRRFGVA